MDVMRGGRGKVFEAVGILLSLRFTFERDSRERMGNTEGRRCFEGSGLDMSSVIVRDSGRMMLWNLFLNDFSHSSERHHRKVIIGTAMSEYLRCSTQKV